MEIKKSLAPVINDSSRVLILGSMPGEESLRRQQYYGYPQNQFWRLIAAVTGQTLPPDDYALRLSMLSAAGIALWDVIASCTREGSLDTMIRDEETNDLPGLIADYPGLNAVFFNGQKAASSFKKAYGFTIFEDAELDYGILPSSSPANTIGFKKKLEDWMIIAQYSSRSGMD